MYERVSERVLRGNQSSKQVSEYEECAYLDTIDMSLSLSRLLCCMSLSSLSESCVFKLAGWTPTFPNGRKSGSE